MALFSIPTTSIWIFGNIMDHACKDPFPFVFFGAPTLMFMSAVINGAPCCSLYPASRAYGHRFRRKCSNAWEWDGGFGRNEYVFLRCRSKRNILMLIPSTDAFVFYHSMTCTQYLSCSWSSTNECPMSTLSGFALDGQTCHVFEQK